MILCALSIVSCGTSHSNNKQSCPGGGFVSLFNGEDLSGWQETPKDKAWKVRDGELVQVGPGKGWLVTEKEYKDFELRFEFMMAPGGNSGIGLRMPAEGGLAKQGMEIQLLDDYAPENSNLKPWQYTGSLYFLIPASIRVSKQAGHWQEMNIICKGTKLQVILNGQEVIDSDLQALPESFGKSRVLARTKGHIGLQHHGQTGLRVRNILVKSE